MRILVTGGAGFIGSEYVRMLLGAPGGSAEGVPALEPTKVTVLDALTYSGNLANLAPIRHDPRLQFIHGNICDTALVNEVVAGHDVIVHFAAESHVDRSITKATPFVTTNILGTQTLLDAALHHHINRFVHVSTDEVYGSITTGSWTEDWPLNPNSPYAATKASSDLLALAYHRTHNLNVVLTRCSNNYGPYQYPEKIIPLFITNLLDGHTIPLYGDGGNIRDWLHVHDHCRGIALAQHKGRAGHIYHIGGGTELTNKQLTTRLLNACNATWDQVTPVPDRKGHDRRYSLDTTKTHHELGYTPTITLDHGLTDTIRWYHNNRTWWQPLKAAAR
ncbi:dTDP-glucose 4,6-dehydratase [Micromonospora sp. CA-263727]|uniref:dTDP-glucose 4,6-dehydratase n=1 Tax=Micromonospora sp. CA-263727 TaxID=3239967 RepID=UPI003D8D9E57